MSVYNVSNHFDVSLDRFLQLSEEPGLMEHLSNDSELAKREAFDRVDDGETVRWKVRLAVDENIPAAVRKLVGQSQLSWTNAFVMNKRTKEMHFTMCESILERFFEFRGDVTLVPEGPQRTRMDLVANFKSKVPLLGKGLASVVGDRLVDGWAKDAASRARYFDKRMQELADAGQLTDAEVQARASRAR